MFCRRCDEENSDDVSQLPLEVGFLRFADDVVLSGLRFVQKFNLEPFSNINPKYVIR